MSRANNDDIYNALSYDTWRKGREIINELRSANRGISYGGFYVKTRELEKQGFVESRDGSDEDGRYREFKKVIGRSRGRGENNSLVGKPRPITS